MENNVKIESTINLNLFCVRDADGNCDVQATLEKFSQALDAWATHVKADVETTMAHIKQLYADHKTDILPRPFVVNQVVNRLGATGLEAFNLASERVNELIDNGPFGSIKGPKGGLFFKGAEHKTERKGKAA